MTTEPDATANRLQRRKQRTRSALIQAAQGFIAAGKLHVPVLEITQAADVGMGSFYNHFQTKDELFAAAVAEVLDAHGALLDRLNESSEDPAEVFARSFRMTGRFFRRRPQESRVLLSSGWAMLAADRGLAPRALRDIVAAAAAGRFQIKDPQVALALAGGVLLGLGQLLHNDLDRDDAQTADQVTEDLLRLFGMKKAEAKRLCHTPLPDIDDLTAPGSAA
ncbi:MAG: TetR/AcrR family transcriptional regulator [Mycobacterium sp.]